jgi:hypothetical protein
MVNRVALESIPSILPFLGPADEEEERRRGGEEEKKRRDGAAI